jgi:amino acid transporter
LSDSTHHDDAAQLAALGIENSQFKREMGLWSNFALGFTYLSPVVGVYTMFAYALATAGPPMWWSFVIVGCGQLLVACTFGEIVSQFPVAGGVYPWARRLWGLKYGWLTGWVYMWALIATISAVAYGAGPYISTLIGIQVNSGDTVICALAILALATIINFSGTKWLSRVAIFGFSAELCGCLAVGFWLLVAHREHGLGVLFHHYGAGGHGSYFPAFVAGALIAMWMYYGFEACGDVAEEVPNPSKVIPKAMRRTIYVGGCSGGFIALALVLGVTNYRAVISGAEPDPITTTLTQAFGSVGMKVILAVVLISYASCVLSLQAAASRLIYSYSRDKMMIGHHTLAKFWERHHIPPYALGLATVIPAAIIILSLISANAVVQLVSFAACGIYVGFQMVVLAALRGHIKGWKPSGGWTMGRWGIVVNALALTYGILAIVNMCWPRGSGFGNRWMTVVGLAVVLVVGLVYMATSQPYQHGDQPYGDAIKNLPMGAKVPATTVPSLGTDPEATPGPQLETP